MIHKSVQFSLCTISELKNLGFGFVEVFYSRLQVNKLTKPTYVKFQHQIWIVQEQWVFDFDIILCDTIVTVYFKFFCRMLSDILGMSYIPILVFIWFLHIPVTDFNLNLNEIWNCFMMTILSGKRVCVNLKKIKLDFKAQASFDIRFYHSNPTICVLKEVCAVSCFVAISNIAIVFEGSLFQGYVYYVQGIALEDTCHEVQNKHVTGFDIWNHLF